jgi:signal transduction histidine kinase/uncharacterized protein with PQ loop repeat
MDIIKVYLDYIYGLIFILNAIIFIPQAVKIIQNKSAKDVSLITYAGLFAIQVFFIFHTLQTRNHILLIGFILSLITTAAVLILTVYYHYYDQKHPENDFQNLINQIPCNIYWKNREGIYLGSNRRNYQAINLTSQAQLIGLSDYDLLDAPIADKVKHFDDEVVRTKKMISREEKIITRKGHAMTYISHKAPLFNKKNEVVGIIGASMNITKRSNELNEKINTLDNIIAMMPGNVYWMNTQGVYQGCNDNQAKLINLNSRKDIIGKRNEDLPGFLIAESLDPHNKKVMNTGKEITIEEPVVLPNGEHGIYLSNKKPLYNQYREIIGLVGISMDITNRKNQENQLKQAKDDAEQAMLIKNEFIKNMEHDLRTPFSGVLGISEMLWMQETDSTKKEALGQLVQGAKQLLDYHNSVLDFSNIASGQLPIIAKKFNLKKLIEHVLSIEAPAAKLNDINLQSCYDDTIPDILVGDEQRVKSILVNLLSNAIKFTKKGDVTIETQAYQRDKDHAIIRFYIKDTGIGIPKDKQDYIFEQFSKLSLSHKGLYKGLGIGLKIVKEFVNDMDGDLELLSKDGQGSTFIISLPFKIPLTDDMATS